MTPAQFVDSVNAWAPAIGTAIAVFLGLAAKYGPKIAALEAQIAAQAQTQKAHSDQITANSSSIALVALQTPLADKAAPVVTSAPAAPAKPV